VQVVSMVGCMTDAEIAETQAEKNNEGWGVVASFVYPDSVVESITSNTAVIANPSLSVEPLRKF